MWTRRQLLVQGAAASLALAHGRWAPSAEPASERKEEDAGNRIPAAARKAIDAGLKLLAEEQREDGSFGTQGYRGNVAVTSLAAMAFMANGSQPNRGPYGRAIRRALRFVLDQENRMGRYPGFLHNPLGSPHGPMYSHGFGTLFLAALHGKVQDRTQVARLGEVLDRAVKLIVSSQNQEGGWRYMPNSKDADVSVTSCQMMALAMARQSGIAVPKKTIDAGVGYIKKCFLPATGGFQYIAGAGPGNPYFARTAAAVAALQAMGIHRGDEVEKSRAYLLRNRPAGEPRPSMGYYYGHYYAARVMHAAGGETWKDWYAAVVKDLLAQKMDNGGWNDQVDPHYATAMACLVLLTPEGRLVLKVKERKE